MTDERTTQTTEDGTTTPETPGPEAARPVVPADVPWPLPGAEFADRTVVPPEYVGAPAKAVADFLHAGLVLDSRFFAEARRAERQAALDAFKEAGRVQGIQTLPAAAITAKVQQIAAEERAATQRAAAEFEAGQRIVAKLLTEMVTAAAEVPTHVGALPKTASRTERLLAGLLDGQEAEQVERWKQTETPAAWAARYARTGDEEHRAFVRAVERGEVPVGRDPAQDVAAIVTLQRARAERQAARVPREVAELCKTFAGAVTATRLTKLSLIQQGHVE